ncbi:MAG TPA: hypothetical protein H9781_10360 [Candidatus Oscillibacter excrementavium]|nr:hypothetical protein [Candidatus Oscillibacter excrementavium]
MNYLVMETHPAYAVLLDEEGRFLKAANLSYQVGDTVQDIVELQPPKAKSPAVWKPLSSLAGLAACVCLVFFGYYQPNYTAYGTLRIQINPDVEMTVSRTDRVLGLEGLNEDGETLIAGYTYQGKNRETATDELVERAIDMGYLSDGDTISITVNSADAEWQAQEETRIQEQLEDRYGESIVIQLGGEPGQAGSPPPEDPVEVVVPITPQTPVPASTPTPTSAPTPAGTNDGSGVDSVPNYDDTDYGPNADGVTDYDDTDYGPNADGVTDYDDTDYGPNADGVTDYTDTVGETYSDGVTDYEDRDDDDWDDTQDDGDDEEDDDDDDDD